MAYVAGFSMAAIDAFDNQKGWLVLPVAGPWLTFALRHTTHCAEEGFIFGCNEKTQVGLAVDGAMQLAGAALVTFALTPPRTWAVPNETTPITLAPLLTAHGCGFSISSGL